jgi:hypothetical protein
MPSPEQAGSLKQVCEYHHARFIHFNSLELRLELSQLLIFATGGIINSPMFPLETYLPSLSFFEPKSPLTTILEIDSFPDRAPWLP